MPNRRTLLAALAAAGLVGCRPTGGGESTGDQESSIGGPFSLIDQDGQPVTEEVLKGHWSAVFFGYTYCPGPCPTSLMALGEGLGRMGRRGEQVQSFLISLDPQRDTPQVLKEYIEANPAFPKGLRGLTGTPEQIAAAAKAYRFYYRKNGEGPDYLIDHQVIIYLMDPEGRLARPLTHDLGPKEIAAQIGDAMRQKA